ncbi:hypothetical protein GLOTRDRAFT_135142 [Gloeophyllum trabeum ATCC 11539]|uniref:LYR motif-containing protein Cup1-like N-terminal domain-containing protein n=1 Tax=Gloeophyllum trabeum (strain ATCC 11539 / FP-39264 / Madison 617) TaxID=670483 RepID=S7S3R8_GLOTA|nr:uncharacterized protein GLOTRDRAFT_135142 [Gloeophyllum trabeum ATCC 11539]EPQ60469.1 hypothetical protein GLOTRDRAFT_135142 [Gloeophyllum trabeum ATCC 11539]
MIPFKPIAHLYRDYLRQVRLLPHEYLRTFFRIKARDDVTVLCSTKDGRKSMENKQKRVSKDIRKLKDANTGKWRAFQYVLDLAYGRKGRLRWELLEPLLQDARSSATHRIIPGVERSRPPHYSPELAALLTSPFSRSHKPLSPKDLIIPPTLPARSDPASEEARLLGPLSKRREANLRWRFFTDQSKKVYPPLQILVQEPVLTDPIPRSDKDAVAQAGIRAIGLQDSGVFEEVQKLALPPTQSSPIPRRHPPTPKPQGEADKFSRSPACVFHSPLPRRFLRRRYQELLGRLPILMYIKPGTPGNVVDSKKFRGVPRPRYEISLSARASGPAVPRVHKPAPSMDSHELAWTELSNKEVRKDAADRDSEQRTAKQKAGVCSEIVME